MYRIVPSEVMWASFLYPGVYVMQAKFLGLLEGVLRVKSPDKAKTKQKRRSTIKK